jgi:hypothetical protein
MIISSHCQGKEYIIYTKYVKTVVGIVDRWLVWDFIAKKGAIFVKRYTSKDGGESERFDCAAHATYLNWLIALIELDKKEDGMFGWKCLGKRK